MTKWELAGIGSLKGIKNVICGTKCIGLTKETINILGVFYAYTEKIELEKVFKIFLLETESFEHMAVEKSYS